MDPELEIFEFNDFLVARDINNRTKFADVTLKWESCIQTDSHANTTRLNLKIISTT